MRPRDVAALIAVAVTLTVATALVGGATRWAAMIAVVLALATALPHLGSRRTASRPGALLRLLGLAAGLTALQLVPVPDMIAEIIMRPRLELADGHAAAFGEPRPTWTVASYDPPATLVELAKLVGYLALAWTAGRLAAQRRNRAWLAAAVVGAAAAAVLVGAAHLALGAERLYGVFVEPPPDAVSAPLLNDNHFASLCALAAPLAVGLALSWAGPRRAAAAFAGLVLAAAALLSGSRGGALALLAGLAVTAVLLVLQRRTGTDDDDHRRKRSSFPAAVVAGSIIVILGLLVTSDVTDELRDTRLAELTEPRSKYQVWDAALPLAGENRWLGIGKGAFETTYPRVAPVGDVTFSHAENSYLQAVLDWGLPGAAALAVLVLVLGREALRRWRHGPLEAGALGGLAAVALHELVDFSLELPAVAMATVCVAAIVAPARTGTEAARGTGPDRRTRWLRTGGLALGMAVVALAASPLGRSAVHDRAALPDEPRARADAARAALARHPADGLAAGHAAQALFAARDDRAVDVAGRALYLRPHHSGLHRLAARMLLAGGRPRQALVEYRLALAWCDDRDAADILDEIVARFPDPADVAHALPTEERQSWRLQKLLGARGRTELQLAYAERVLVFEPGRADAHHDLARAALRLGRGALARPHAEAAHERLRTTASALTQARAQAATGDRAAAIETLRAAPSTRDGILAADVAAELAAHLRTTGAVDDARRVLLAAIDATVTPELEAVLRRHLATVEEAAGNPHRAAFERQRADELAPPPRSTEPTSAPR